MMTSQTATAQAAQGPLVAMPELPGPSLPALLLHHAATRPDHVALRKKQWGRWRQYTWGDYLQRTTDVANGLRSLGVTRGDRVAIQSDNRPAWLFADLATQTLGAIAVGVYPTSPPAELEFILHHSASKVLFAENEEQLDKVLEVRGRLPTLQKVVVIDPRGIRQLGGSGPTDATGNDVQPDPMLMTLAELEALGRDSAQDLAADIAAINPSEPTVIVYTSGTTGPPKGALLSQDNLLAAARCGIQAFPKGSNRDEILSYLPLCHIAERLISVVNGLGRGYVVSFSSIETLADDLREVQPTFFLGVPRVWEKLLGSVVIKMGDSSRLKRLNFAFWMRVGTHVARKRMRGEMNPLDQILYGLGWLLLYRQLREKLGLVRVQEALSGAAPIAPQVLQRFWAMGVPVREAYGQTENAGVATIMPGDDVRIGKVGQPYPTCEVRIGDHGEILTRAPTTFLGYYKNPEATANTVDEDGWLHTGDVGVLDSDGFLTITDRMKDIIITAGGKNVSPSEIENALKVSPFVNEAVVVGDERKYLVALIGIEQDTVSAWARRRKLTFTTYADMTSKPEVHELIGDWVEQVNQRFAQAEQIKRFDLFPKELDQEAGEVTATQKVKRRAIEKEYGTMIEALYAPSEGSAASGAGTGTGVSAR